MSCVQLSEAFSPGSPELLKSYSDRSTHEDGGCTAVHLSASFCVTHRSFCVTHRSFCVTHRKLQISVLCVGYTVIARGIRP